MYPHRPPQLNPHAVHALLSGWYDLVGPQVGQSYGPYGGRVAAGYNPYAMMGYAYAGQAPAAAPARRGSGPV